MGYVFPTLIAMGFGYAINGSGAGKSRWSAAAGPGPAFALVAVGAVVAMIPVSLGLRLGALHFLSADDRQSLLLHRRRDGRGRLMDLGRADVDQYGDLEAREPDKPVPLAMFANVAGAYLWGWTAVGAALEIIFQILPVALGLRSTDRRRAGAGVLLLDAACDRLFLADPDLHRLSTRSSRARSAAGSTATRWRGLPSSCSSWWRCRSACIICLPIRRSAPDLSSCIRSSPGWWRCRRC